MNGRGGGVVFGRFAGRRISRFFRCPFFCPAIPRPLDHHPEQLLKILVRDNPQITHWHPAVHHEPDAAQYHIHDLYLNNSGRRSLLEHLPKLLGEGCCASPLYDELLRQLGQVRQILAMKNFLEDAAT